MNDIVPTKTLVKRGVNAVAGIGGGLGLMVLNFIVGIPVIGIVAGAVVTVIGLGGMSSPAGEDKRMGLIATAAGGLMVIKHLDKVPIIGAFAGIAGSLVTVGTIGLLAMGAWNAYKFVKGLKSRA